jgi:hypothetical protein
VTPDADSDLPLYRPYIVGDERTFVLTAIERLADFAEGPWRRAVRSGDMLGDVAIKRVADGIAAALRHWKPVLVVGGSGLERARQAFATALLNIAAGEWNALAAEVSPRDLLGHRLMRWSRRLMALCVIFAALYLALMPPAAMRAALGALPLIPIGATILALGIDPSLADRFGLIGKVTGVLPGSKQSH